MRKSFVLVLCMCLIMLHAVPVFAAGSGDTLKGAVEKSGEYMVKAVSSPQCANIGGEWAVIGLARSGCAVPEGYYEKYYASVENYVKACGGVLHAKKYTEYSRVILGLTAIGKDPANVAGYNLLTPLGDYEKTIWQGINGPIWALIALDSAEYEFPVNGSAKVQATRQMYVDEILSHQLANGGWTLGGTGGGSMAADPDMTGMALQALAKYTDQKRVSDAVEKALACLSGLQNGDGGYDSWGTVNSESCAQVLVALCELGIDLNDPRFVKNGKSVLDNLLAFRKSDGSFVHVMDGDSGSNQMSTEQGFYGIVAAMRTAAGKTSLYRMSDAVSIGGSVENNAGSGLPGKNADVKSQPVTKQGMSFSDVSYEDNITAIEALAAREIINGMGDGTFSPKSNMTRAQFATIVVKALGLTPKAGDKFKDVAAVAWYAPYIGTANAYGIVNGVSDTEFNPDGTITRQEAATMVARAAKLCGMDTGMNSAEVRDMLAQFGDYPRIADWAKETVAFCYKSGILDQADIDVEPVKPILRCEIAQMIYNMLLQGNLL